MKLLDTIFKRKAKRQADHWQTYRDILWQDEAEDAQAEDLEAVIDALGLSPAQVSEDAEAVKRAKELLPHVEGFDNARQKYRDAQQEFAEAVTERDKLEAKALELWQQAQIGQHKAEARLNKAIEARKELEQMKASRPQLFGTNGTPA